MMDKFLLLLMTFLAIACASQVLSNISEFNQIEQSGWLNDGSSWTKDDTSGGDGDGDHDNLADSLFKLQQKIILNKSQQVEDASLKESSELTASGPFDWIANNLSALRHLNGGDGENKNDIVTINNEDVENNELDLDVAKITNNNKNLATEEDRKRIVAKILAEPLSKAARGNTNGSNKDIDLDSDDEDSDNEEDTDEDDDNDDEWDNDDDDDRNNGRNASNDAQGKQGESENNKTSSSDKVNPMDYIFADGQNKQNTDSDKNKRDETIDSIENEIDEKNLEPRKKKFLNLEDEEVEYNLNNVKLFIYSSDRHNESTKFFAEPPVDSIIDCDIDFTGKVAAVSHGFYSSSDSESMVLLRQELVKLFDVVIYIDWSPYGQLWMYKTSARSTRVFGEIFGKFIADLHEHKGLRYDQLHMMGYSLGAHIAAFASRQIALLGDGTKPKRLTVFDPALPLIADAKGVRMTDADIVQVIHTNAGFFGQTEKRGHIDFYPNGGNNQPGCGSESTLTMKSQGCDHARAIMLFTEAIKEFTGDGKESECEFVGYPCDSYNDYLLGKCSSCNNGLEEQCRMLMHDSQPVEGIERIKSLYLVGGGKDALCAPNYHVELIYWPDVELTKLSLKLKLTPLVIKFKTRKGHILKASFDMSSDRPMALLVDHGKPTKIKNARIQLESYHNLIKSMKVTYLSHTNVKVIEKYSTILCFYKNSVVRGELFVTSKRGSCRHNDRPEKHDTNNNALVGTPFYKQAKFGLPSMKELRLQ